MGKFLELNVDVQQFYELFTVRFTILDFLVSGCADLVPGPGMRMTRDADQLIVGCDVSSSTWHLTCVDDKWTGVIGNCSQCASSVYLIFYNYMILTWDSCTFCLRWKCIDKHKSKPFTRGIIVFFFFFQLHRLT